MEVVMSLRMMRKAGILAGLSCTKEFRGLGSHGRRGGLMRTYARALFALLLLVAFAAPGTIRGESLKGDPAEGDQARRSDAAAAGEGAEVARVNDWTVGIAGGQLEGTFLRMAAEIGKALDDGDNLRILPVLTYGAVDNLSDLLYMHGVDVAITYADDLDQFKRSGAAKNIDQRI